MNFRPISDPLTLMACAAWGAVLADMVLDVMSPKAFSGLLALSATVSACAAIHHHGTLVKAVTREHAGTMGKQVLSAERMVTLRWRGESRAIIDAAEANSEASPTRFAEEWTP